MGNISIKLNLTQFNAVIRPFTGKDGKPVDCVVLPIEKNHFFRGDKGVYVDLIAFELKQKQDDRKDTHSIKQSFSKEHLEKLSQEEKNALPFIGSLIVWSENQTSEKPPVEQKENDDLPF